MPALESKITSKAIKKFERKISRKGGVRAGKRFTLLISNEDMNVIIKIMKSLKDSGVLIDGINKKTRRWTSWCFVSTFGCFIGTTSDFFSDKRY